MALWLDEAGHVHHTGIGNFSHVEAIAAFVATFPLADLSELRPYLKARLALEKRYLDGSAYWTINGKRQEQTDEDRARITSEINALQALL